MSGTLKLPPRKETAVQGGLRFICRDGRYILQQQWEVRSHTNVYVGHEWRDVPLVMDPQPVTA